MSSKPNTVQLKRIVGWVVARSPWVPSETQPNLVGNVGFHPSTQRVSVLSNQHCLGHDHATIDVKDLSGDVGSGWIGCEEAYHTSNFFWLTVAA